jgi:hypothetical protein
VTMYKMCANGCRGAADNNCICLHGHAPMGDHMQRFGHVHGWNLGRLVAVGDCSAKHCVSPPDGMDVSWLLGGVEQTDVVEMRMSGGYDGRTLAYHPSD